MDDKVWIEGSRLVNGFRAYQIVAAACRLKLPDLVAAGPRTAAELAAQTGMQPAAMKRLLKGLAAWRILTDGTDGSFSATPLSDLFRSDRPGFRNITVMLSEEGYRAWGDVMYSLETGKPAYPHLLGQTRWETLAKDPKAAAEFNAAMVEITNRVARSFIAGYDLAGAETIVDVGGGNGALLAAVLHAHPRTRGILFDLPAGLSGAEETFKAEGLDGRVRLVEGSFFESLPPDGDLYILKSIIHDWDDEHDRLILQTCRRAMRQGSRLVLIERFLPERIEDPDGAMPIVMSDLQMLVCWAAENARRASTASCSQGTGSA